MDSIKGSVVRATGVCGTYQCKMGGIGLGYRINGTVYSDGGNGHYYPEDVNWFLPDNGDHYMGRVRRLSLPPAYTR